MVKKTAGWLAVIWGFFSLALSIAPGAMSLIGFVATLFALALSLFSVAPNQTGYFWVVMLIVIVGLFLVNDSLRIFGALPNVPWQFKFVTYGLSFVVIIASVFASRKLSSNDGKKA